jgi:FtsZ-interacting cell division protein YlmF
MASFMQKALQYLGLKDIDNDGFYDDEDLGDPGPGGARTTYPEPAADIPTGTVATVRPLVRDDTRDFGSSGGRGVVRPFVAQRQTKPQVVAPARFSDAQEIGDLVKANNPVIVNLQSSERDLARRMIDFCSGLTYALSGSMEKVADQVFLLTPSNVDIPPEERRRLTEPGVFRP